MSKVNRAIASGAGLGILVGIYLSQFGMFGKVAALILAIVAIFAAFYFRSRRVL